MNYVLADKSIAEAMYKALGGGKAYNLYRMMLKDIKVPPFITVTAEALEAYLQETKVLKGMNYEQDLATISASIEERFLSQKIPSHLLELILKSLEKLRRTGEIYFAVRSSGLEEDSDDLSFAGLFSSYLFQKTDEEIELSLRKCWASAYSERALFYRKKNNLSLEKIKMGVVIQVMIPSQKAGVLFTKNPINPLDRETILLEAVWGQGEGLVSGAIEAEQYFIKKEAVEVIATTQEEQYLQSPHLAGIAKVSLDESQRGKQILDESEIDSLKKMAIKIEELYDVPMDIEWAIYQKDLYILQMRPITTLPPNSFFDPSVLGNRPMLWDNSNIIESFSGVTTPLTFSCTKKAYEVVYRETCRLFKVPEKTILENHDAFENMLGFIRGRVYYNLINWYRLLLLMPGFSSNKGFMETMMGVKEDLHEEHQKLFSFMENAPKYGLLKRLQVLGFLIYRFKRIDLIIERFFQNFNKNYYQYKAIDLSSKSIPELLSLYENWDQNITYRWDAPIINDMRCMVFFGTLKKLTEKWIKIEGINTESLQNDLLCGEGDLESTMPTKSLMKLAERIDLESSETRDFFINTPLEEIYKEFKSNPTYQSYFEQFEDYIDKYGFRCINEQKLEEKDLTEDPTFALNAIKSYLKMKSYSVQDMEKRELEIRNKAEKLVRENLGFGKKIIYNWVLKNARHAVKSRENLRFCRTKSFGIIRKIFRQLGLKMTTLKLIERPSHLFYLSFDELQDFNKGTPLTLNLSSIAQMREAEYKNYQETADPPDRFVTAGLPGAYFRDQLILSNLDLIKSNIPISDDPDLFYGVSCCPGEVEGEVLVAKKIEDTEQLNGQILIAPRTDPGWVPLYPSCKGLIVERGSLLSHSAVVARELGLPTIVGVSGSIIEKLNSGDKVYLNASKGEIRVLERAEQ